MIKISAKLVQFAQDTVGWYTSDWVARERRCSHCDWKAYSIEIIDEDVAHVLRKPPDDSG